MKFKYSGIIGSVDEQAIKRNTGISSIEWKKLSGLFSTDLPPSFADYIDFEISGLYPSLLITGNNSNFFLEMRCNLEYAIVYIINFEIFDQRKGYASKAFFEHLRKAKEFGFRSLQCKASAEINPRNNEKYVGYYTWGKFGFTMREESHLKFTQEMAKINRRENCLQKLLYTEEGDIFWFDNGFSWKAQFNLKPSPSINEKIFRKYHGLPKLK